ncbi:MULTISPECIES: enoyl-CoA hydratase/isomerase family protein [Streptomyces]|uniref:Enoyl-CoA hydratase n=1 Tax=Streptomyces tsukubensis (strain DSM 42081 / NBRC 108919 / NRRL 18488 / 9993) TaxID=1114943 RepID=I2N9K4_STRT9|nr:MULTISPECIES: enoyl-CoA hydratase-related protein [Streptomyces]AZK97540.1 enoyl-CoA hydratase [Streptomyces tsukubensis]EIF93701.1 enoyl-CoA hydratase/isomerase [Streptomyces tsukubensis NRRL18488]MYS68050.1 enoyl-CoA hydratase/isomerase family protein [Streptomyces sp. SID5473]QKM66514.1 enoyl-CoA hydratase [Streptomyces tsukubensis NRRL18488]TAI45146.1 enoyl-CoA hydratase/isomerase family protein [Streptomyces tsukubensis]
MESARSGPEPRIVCTVTDGVAKVVIDNPAKRNAMTKAMWRAVPELLARLAVDPAVRVLVLTGEGPTFCAGADIASLRGADTSQEPGCTDGSGGSDGSRGSGGADGSGTTAGTGGADETPQALAVLAEEALAAFPKPTLAAVRGHCVGGGCQLAVACDLRFASDGALFGVTPARLGVVYPATATRRLVELVGPSAAKYLLFSGELIDSGRALRTGLVDEVLPESELDVRVAGFARILTERSQLTQVAAKEFATGRTDRAEHWERLAAEQARPGGDTAEGVAAFLERRTPRFTWSV